MKKAVAAVLLAVLLVCAVFSSCGKKEDGAVTGNGNTTRSAAQNAVTNAGDAVGDAVTGAGEGCVGRCKIKLTKPRLALTVASLFYLNRSVCAAAASQLP